MRISSTAGATDGLQANPLHRGAVRPASRAEVDDPAALWIGQELAPLVIAAADLDSLLPGCWSRSGWGRHSACRSATHLASSRVR